MSEMEKYVEMFTKVFNKSVEAFEAGTKELSVRLQKEKKKVELKSQIGQHERQMAKAYERMGEAYFKHLEEGVEMEPMDDILDLLRSNKKVIALLQEQPNELEEK